MPRHLSNTCYTSLLSRSSRYVHKRKKGGGKCLGLFMLGACGTLGAAALSSGDTYAITVPDVSIAVGSAKGNQTLAPGKVESGSAHYFVPVEITTANSDSHSIYIYADGSNNNLVSPSGNTIKSITENKTVSDMSDEWGYRWSLTDTNPGNLEPEAAALKPFSAMPTSKTPIEGLQDIDTAETHGSHKYLSLGFGANVTGNTVAEQYTGNIIISVVANPQKMTIFDIDYMQDMTHDICDNTTTPKVTGADDTVYATNKTQTWNTSTKTWDVAVIPNANLHKGDENYVPQTTLIDKRDNKAYLVKKLADGNCWMSQNLELDFLGNSLVGQNDGTKQNYYNGTTATTEGLPVGAPEGSMAYGGAEVAGTFRLTDEDTDLHSMTTWTPALAAQKYQVTSGYFNTGSGIVEATSEASVGIKTYATRIQSSENGNNSLGWSPSGYGELRSFSYTGSNDSWTYSNPVQKVGGTFETQSNGVYQFANASSSTESGLRRKGNLYNYTAATLGSNNSPIGSETLDSICAKGWSLPQKDGDRSYGNLLQTYGLASGTNIVASEFNEAHTGPIGLTPAGFYSVSNGMPGSLRYMHAHGRWWVNYIFQPTNGYILDSRPSNPSDDGIYLLVRHDPMGFGFSVRCVAR